MAIIITYEQMVEDTEEMLREACKENDVDYEEFLTTLEGLL